MRSKANIKKAIQVLLYVTKPVPDMYHALKALYFADMDHLARYGRLIYGDSYVAMNQGPVPSVAYDIVKNARGDDSFLPCIQAREYLAVAGYQVTPRQEADLGQLSETDVECLDRAIAQYGSMPLPMLRRKSHEDPAFQAADENDFMPIEAIVAGLPDSEGLLDYIRDY